MGGGELQLSSASKGQIDTYLIGNPEVSFYQYVYKRHTNFALESKAIFFEKLPVLSMNEDETYLCKLEYHGQLLTDLYFCFELPAIYSSDKYKFRWVKNVGTVFIKEAVVNIEGVVIDKLTGEWMNIWNELSLPAGDNKYDMLIGNKSELIDPKSSFPRVSIRNNRFIYFYYPEADKTSNVPSIPSTKLIIPLQFWFTKNPSLALPFFKYKEALRTYLKITLQSSEKLYQVYSDKLDMYISPKYYNELTNLHNGDNINIYSFVKETGSISINAYIEANYVFLDTPELQYLIDKSELTYIVDQLTYTTFTSVQDSKLQILVNNPTKELIWVLKRDDIWKYNEHFNFSADIPESNNALLQKCEIYFNDTERVSSKNAEYFNQMQPFQHHTKIPKQGIYCYSFALYPEKEMLSGHYNAALVKTKFYVEISKNYNNDFINNKLKKYGIEPYKVNYDLTVYTLNMNMFLVTNSQAGMVFTVST